MMKKMGIEQTEVEGAKEVIIRFSDKEWVIQNPEVVVVKQGNSESFQISGSKTERAKESGKPIEEEIVTETEIEIPVEDAALVAGQTGVSIETAIEALRESGGDLAAAILKLRRT
jgi:nascent polypeptide-associated complex subunit alpha